MLGRPPPRPGPARTIEVPAPTIIPATDLGSVDVGKEGNLYLLTDPRGDIRLDGRGLGLYDLDTRVLSTSILRLNGSQLTLLRGPDRDGGADTIQLTNPELRRNPADKHAAPPSLARRELSLTRTRRIDGTLREQVTIESYSATTEALEIVLGLGVDMADIFEVRGYPRTTAARSARSSCTTIGSSSPTRASTAGAARRRCSSRGLGSTRPPTTTCGPARACWPAGGRNFALAAG